MRDLVDDGVRNHLPELVVVPGDALDVLPEQRDAVGQHAGIVVAPLGQGDALVQAEEPRLTGRGAVLHDDLDVVHGLADPVGEAVHGLGRQLLEPLLTGTHASSISWSVSPRRSAQPPWTTRNRFPSGSRNVNIGG